MNVLTQIPSTRGLREQGVSSPTPSIDVDHANLYIMARKRLFQHRPQGLRSLRRGHPAQSRIEVADFVLGEDGHHMLRAKRRFVHLEALPDWLAAPVLFRLLRLLGVGNEELDMAVRRQIKQ